jgi:hypothetical protein
MGPPENSSLLINRILVIDMGIGLKLTFKKVEISGVVLGGYLTLPIVI